MLELLKSLTPEAVTGIILGCTTLGIVTRSVFVGWTEARARLNSSAGSAGPLASAIALTWDKDQVERALQALEAIAEAMDLQCKFTGAIAEAQGVMSDQFQQTTQSKLNELLDRLDTAETGKRTTPRRRRPRAKPKSTA